VASHSALVWKKQVIFSGGDLMEGQCACFVAAAAGSGALALEELHMMDLSGARVRFQLCSGIACSWDRLKKGT